MGGRLLIGVFVSLAACLPSEDLKNYSDGSTPRSAGAMAGTRDPVVDVGMGAPAAPSANDPPAAAPGEVAPAAGSEEAVAPASLDPSGSAGDVGASDSRPAASNEPTPAASSDSTPPASNEPTPAPPSDSTPAPSDSTPATASGASDGPSPVGSEPSAADATPAGSEPEPAEVPVSRPQVRFVRFVADAAVQGPFTAIAEFNVLDGAGQPIDRTGWVASADSEELAYVGGARASLAIDGATVSIWHTAWFLVNPPPAHPHTLDLDMGTPHEVSGFRYLGRQDASLDGRVSRYRFFVSADGLEWGEPVASGSLENTTAEQEVRLAP